MFWFYIFIFAASCILLYFSGELIMAGLIRAARFLSWREFVVTFFIISFATSIPELFIGIFSVLNKIPELSLGGIVGANVINLTLVIALATLVTKTGITAKSRVIQDSAIFTIFIAILPLLLILDGILTRADGIVLISVFIFYNFWLFSRKERFVKIYDGEKVKNFKIFFTDLVKIIIGIIILLMATGGIVKSAAFFVKELNSTLALVGILIVGLGTSLPDLYFAFASAKKGETWMVLGNTMGSIIISTTLILGVVVLLSPIEIPNFSPFAVARIFLIISALLFLFFIQSGKKISKNEGYFLLLVYIVFVVVEILLK
jgi:cation:H+ antiporter